MEIKTNIKEEITFDIEGASGTAFIENNKIMHVKIELSGSGQANLIQCDDERFLRDAYKALGNLVKHVDDKRNVGRKDMINVHEGVHRDWIEDKAGNS